MKMTIKCLLKREGGTKVDIDGVEYHFAPNEDGDHVCEVSNKKHIARFLSIPEGYEIHGSDDDSDQTDDEDNDLDESSDDSDDGSKEPGAESGLSVVGGTDTEDDQGQDQDAGLDDGSGEPEATDTTDTQDQDDNELDGGDDLGDDLTDSDDDAQDQNDNEPEDDEKPLDKWTDDELFSFAKSEMGIDDPANKDELELYGKEMYQIDLNKTFKPANLIRQLITKGRELADG